MNTYTLTNDFHNTSVNIRTVGTQHIWSEIEITLTPGQMKRTKKSLCGVEGCTCSNAAGIRGNQVHWKGSSSSRLIINFSE